MAGNCNASFIYLSTVQSISSAMWYRVAESLISSGVYQTDTIEHTYEERERERKGVLFTKRRNPKGGLQKPLEEMQLRHINFRREETAQITRRITYL